MTSANRMDCRPIQFRQKKYPKNTDMCKWYCPFWFVCHGITNKPKPSLTKKQLKKAWDIKNKLKIQETNT